MPCHERARPRPRGRGATGPVAYALKYVPGPSRAPPARVPGVRAPGRAAAAGAQPSHRARVCVSSITQHCQPRTQALWDSLDVLLKVRLDLMVGKIGFC